MNLRVLLTATAFLLLSLNPAVAQPSKLPLPAGVKPCAFDAGSRDPDPNGLNIRQAPNASARILGQLPDVEVQMGPKPADTQRLSAEFHVIGTEHGWFLIEGAHYRYFGYGHHNVPFSGRGWVSGTLITNGDIQSTYLKSAPRETASNVVKLTHDDKRGHTMADPPTAIVDCSGKWIRVEMPLKQRHFELKPLMPTDAPPGYIRGWTDFYCLNPFTTCV